MSAGPYCLTNCLHSSPTADLAPMRAFSSATCPGSGARLSEAADCVSLATSAQDSNSVGVSEKIKGTTRLPAS